ncbi:protein mono-ADP-ribosyltransferase PARP14-like isoform X3 [Rana temporaria]|uniref:protein mono-ADP-ribosyltransferase PARP14-like isoform X3 n=1 Tax=Rana temporaria TaxID=8407 RepID=UPI001AACB37A|nr:protein mono-ADP-ribosyltransferase PARP14-like isoform X3 [Rana temporaria]
MAYLIKSSRCEHKALGVNVIMSEVVLGNTSVEIKLGDITSESTDAIVNLTNATLDQDFGVSKNILASAGPRVKAECASLCKFLNDGCVVTGAGNLQSKMIIHLIDVQPANITQFVKKSLKACKHHRLHSISLPAIGTGSAKLDPQSSIQAIMKGIEEFLLDPVELFKPASISTINIVVLDLDVYCGYLRFFQNYKPNYFQFTVLGKKIELIKGDITDQAVDCIVNLANQTLNQKSGVSGAILSAAGKTVEEECKRIGQILIDPEESIKAILESTFKYLSEMLLPNLETISIVVIQENIYKTYLKVFVEQCRQFEEQQRKGKIQRAIQAQVIITYPPTWTNPGIEDFEEISLDTTSEEYRTIKKYFLDTSRHLYNNVQITRIQNKKLWQSFSLNKQMMDQKNPGLENIRHLYHGTTVNEIHNISHGGFNRNYCGKNGTVCGYGTYFAVKSEYSCNDQYSAPDKNGYKHVFQAAVIIGRYCKGDQSLLEPPYIDAQAKKQRYDSVVDNVQNITYFAVFHDDHAYPEYLIKFKP